MTSLGLSPRSCEAEHPWGPSRAAPVEPGPVVAPGRSSVPGRQAAGGQVWSGNAVVLGGLRDRGSLGLPAGAATSELCDLKQTTSPAARGKLRDTQEPAKARGPGQGTLPSRRATGLSLSGHPSFLPPLPRFPSLGWRDVLLRILPPPPVSPSQPHTASPQLGPPRPHLSAHFGTNGPPTPPR